jgi:hypothetical protein
MLDSSFDAKISAAIINRCCTEAMWGRPLPAADSQSAHTAST